MKKLIILPALLLIAGLTYGQTLPKGSIASIHVIDISLNPDATMNQFLDAFTKNFLDAVEENTEGMKALLLKWDRGENENSYAYAWIFESAEARAKYFPEPDQATEAWNEVIQKVQSSIAEVIILGNWSEVYTDWVVQ